MTPFELIANKPVMIQNNQINQGLQLDLVDINGIPLKFDTRHSVRSGEFVARTTFINGERIQMDQCRAQDHTFSPDASAAIVQDSWYMIDNKAVQQMTSGVQVSESKGKAYSKLVNS